jgi:hypothetical protein
VPRGLAPLHALLALVGGPGCVLRSALPQDIEYVAVLIDCPPTVGQTSSAVANRFVGHDYAADEQHFFHVTMAETAVEIQPDGVADALTREPNPTEAA